MDATNKATKLTKFVASGAKRPNFSASILPVNCREAIQLLASILAEPTHQVEGGF